MSSEPRIFTVGAAPHRRSPSGLSRMHYATLFLLLPTALVGTVAHAFGDNASQLQAAYGPMNKLIHVLTVEMGLDSGVLWFFGILGTVALGAGAGVFFEYAAQVMMRQPYRATDGHGALMGLLLALLMPPTVPWWVLILGVAVAVVLGKQLFGGIGGYSMHPAVVGWLVLLLSYSNYLYPVGSASIAAASQASVAVTFGAGLVLWLLGYIRPQIWAGMLVSVVLFSLLFASRLDGSLADQLLTGHVVLGAFFIATDPTASPANRRGMWAFGAIAGFLVVLIRAFGIWPDAVPFAIMLANILTPLLDRWRPRVRPLGVA